MGVVVAITLILIAVGLFLAVKRKLIGSETLEVLANVAGIVALLAAVLVFVLPVEKQNSSSSIPITEGSSSTPPVSATMVPQPTFTIEQPNLSSSTPISEVSSSTPPVNTIYVDQVRTYAGYMGSGGYKRSNPRIELDLDANQPYSINEKAIIVEIGDIRYCSESFITNSTCPYPSASNDTQIIDNAWIQDKSIITWLLPFELPADKAFSISLSFKPNPDLVEDGDMILVKPTRYWIDKDYNNLERALTFPGQMYVIQFP